MWPIVSSFLSTTLTHDRWCQVWDQLVRARTPMQLLCFGVALAQAVGSALMASDSLLRLDALLHTPLKTVDVPALIASSSRLLNRAGSLKLTLEDARSRGSLGAALTLISGLGLAPAATATQCRRD